MSQSFVQYVSAVRSAISSENGQELRDLLALDNPAAMQGVFEAQQNNRRWDPSGVCSGRLESPWDDTISSHALCLASLLKGNRVQAYDHLKNSVTCFLQAFRADLSAWCIGPMHAVVHNARSVATAADEELRRTGKKASKLNDAGSLLQKCFSAALQGHGNKAKKLATLEVVNMLFKIYFSLNTLRLCKNLIKSVDSPLLPNFENFPLSQRVTYCFYVGRLAVFDEDYVRAKENLSFAYRNCHPEATRNQALILKYLIPVQMLLGALPRDEMLQQHKLGIFSELSVAMRTGSIRLYNGCMDKNQNVFIQAGTFLLLEKLKMSIFRKLFRQVAAIHKEMEPSKSSQIPMGLFQAALASEGVEMDMDEVECVLANLIYRKYIKGYMSHQHKVVVISKADAFPPLKTTILVDIN